MSDYPRKISTLAIRGIAMAMCLVIACFNRAAAAEAIETFDIAKGGDCILVPVTVGGRKCHFLLDTGASGSVYDIKLRYLLGSQKDVARVKTPSGGRSIMRFEALPTKLGKLDLTYYRNEVLCDDMGEDADTVGRRIDGILGMDAIKSLILSLDFDIGKLSIMSSVDPDAGEPVTLVWHKRKRYIGGPFILASIGGHAPREFLVDTGCDGLSSGGIETRFFDWLNVNGEIGELGTSRLYTLGGTSLTKAGRATTASVGSYKYRGAIFDRQDKNVLGLGFLCRFKVTFDFPNSVMYLRKGENFDRLDVYNLSGIHLVRRNGETIVHSVDSESAGSAAGVRQGDVLLAVNETNASDLSMFDLRQRLCSKGYCKLTVRRAQTELKIDLQLVDKSAPGAAQAKEEGELREAANRREFTE